MKIALLTDTHFGAKQDSQRFHKYIEKFYSEQFFPYLHDNNIKDIIILGDTFDRRKYINYVSLQKSKEYFFDKLHDYKVDMIVGNHDTSFRNTNWPNSPQLLLQQYDNINVIAHPVVKEYDGVDIILMPWINDENEEESMDMIAHSDAKVLFGHLNVAGFAMHKGYSSDGGLEPKKFKDFDLVCSGHFHHRSRNKNIQYLGAPYEITWNDYDDPKGFHIFDSSDNSLEFIENTNILFHKIYYDDTINNYDTCEMSDYNNKYVRLIVEKKENYKMFDALVERLYKQDLSDLNIIEDFSEFSIRYQDVDEAVDVENTVDLLKGYVDKMQVSDSDKHRVETELRNLYCEAIEIE